MLDSPEYACAEYRVFKANLKTVKALGSDLLLHLQIKENDCINTAQKQKAYNSTCSLFSLRGK